MNRCIKPMLFCLCLLQLASAVCAQEKSGFLGPTDLVFLPDRQQLIVALLEASRIDVIDIRSHRRQRHISLPLPATGLAIDPRANLLYVTAGKSFSKIYVIDVCKQKIIRTIAAGHSAISPVLNRQGDVLYICNRFENQISVIDLENNAITNQIPVSREPIAASLAKNDSLLVIAHHLADHPSNGGLVACKVTLFETKSGKRIREILLPNGSTGVRDLCVSPEGRLVFVTHLIGRYTVPTTQLEQGWMNTNATSIIDLNERKLWGTVLLDDATRGAANPWGVTITDNGEKVCVAHAGTHEISVIDLKKLIKKLRAYRDHKVNPTNTLSFLEGFRKRVRLMGKGPRALLSVGNSIFSADYFSGTVSLVNVDRLDLQPTIISLGQSETSLERHGEEAFNDALFCFQNWQSCASCHPDGRADGLNWDLLNDGIGNPKNAKSLLFSHQTPPAMSTGIRADAETAVRAGMRYIQFAEHPEFTAEAIDAYLQNLQPIESPFANEIREGESVKRGKKLFFSKSVGCSRCHPAPLYTDQKQHNVGTTSTVDSTIDAKGRGIPQLAFDTPTLREVWRTAPYLHDGRFTTLKEVITTGNHANTRGHTSQLSPQQIDDLLSFLRSL